MLAASSASSDAGYSERTLGLQHLAALDLGRRAAFASQPRVHEINSGRFPSKSASRNTMSGSHTARPELQRLLEAATQTRGTAFQVVIVDDLSRLSRDLWNMGNIVFNDLPACGVVVMDVMTSTASDSPVARQLFAAMGMGNNHFLQMVKTETHRWLEGRALAGFWTGGRVYGYTMVAEPNPQDPEHPRAVPTINAAEATVIQRVHRQYLEGYGLSKIARGLNDDGIPAPYDRGQYGKVGGPGWGSSTVRALLENERYVGHWIWNRRKWVKVPGKKAKRCTIRPRSEWIERDLPALAIVEQPVWDAVRRRFSERKAAGKARVHGESKRAHLLSGCLRCGVCGSTMNIVGSKNKAGVRYYHYGCSAATTRGASICANTIACSERKVEAAIIGALRDLVCQGEFIPRFVTRFNARLVKKKASPKKNEAELLDRQIAEVDVRIKNLAQAVAKSGWFEALAEQLKTEEANLRALKTRRSQTQSVEERSFKGASQEAVEGYFKEFVELLEKDPLRGRLAIKRHIGTMIMTPSVEGANRFYTATGAFNLRRLILLKTFDPAPISEDRVSVESLCGGRI